MKTVGLVLLLTREMWGTGEALIIDRGLCVLKIHLEMRKSVFHGRTLIKRGDIGQWEVHVYGINNTSSQKYW